MSQHIPDQNLKISTVMDYMMDKQNEKDEKERLWEYLVECNRRYEKLQAEINTSTLQVCELKLLSAHVAVINDIEKLKVDLEALDKRTHNLYLVVMNPEKAKFVVMNPEKAKLYDIVEDD